MQVYVYYDRAARIWVARYPVDASADDDDAIAVKGRTHRDAREACMVERFNQLKKLMRKEGEK